MNRPRTTPQPRDLRLRVRRIARLAVLTALALTLSVVERWIPLELVIPVPGVKLGLANIVTLFALFCLTFADALVILLVRALAIGFLFGPTTAAFSFGGGFLALLIMFALLPLENKKILSPLGVSLAGAAAHNLGQVTVAAVMLGEARLLSMYLPPLLLTGLATGLLTGIAAYPAIRRFRNGQIETITT